MPEYLVSVNPSFLTAEVRAAFIEAAGGCSLNFVNDRDEIASFGPKTSVAIGDLPRDLISTFPKLDWYQQFGTGCEWLLEHPTAVEHAFILTNCSDNHRMVIADHVFALMLSYARSLPACWEAQKSKKWIQSPPYAPGRFELRGKTVLILGFGSIGREVARRASCFGMRVIGVRRDSRLTDPLCEEMYGLDQIARATAKADFVVNALPMTEITRGSVDAGVFAAMKTGSYFINVGRGATVDEDAMVQALASGTLAGAGLDVFCDEPLRSDSPLWNLDNVILTPHIGGSHDQLYQTWLEVAIDNLSRYTRGEPLRNVVDKQQGY